jgi:hypothetical protein
MGRAARRVGGRIECVKLLGAGELEELRHGTLLRPHYITCDTSSKNELAGGRISKFDLLPTQLQLSVGSRSEIDRSHRAVNNAAIVTFR